MLLQLGRPFEWHGSIVWWGVVSKRVRTVRTMAAAAVAWVPFPCSTFPPLSLSLVARVSPLGGRVGDELGLRRLTVRSVGAFISFHGGGGGNSSSGGGNNNTPYSNSTQLPKVETRIGLGKKRGKRSLAR